MRAKTDGGPAFPVMRAVHDAIEPTDDELIIRGCGKMLVDGRLESPEALIGEWPEVLVNVTAVEASTESQLTFYVKLIKHDKDTKLWVLKP